MLAPSRANIATLCELGLWRKFFSVQSAHITLSFTVSRRIATTVSMQLKAGHSTQAAQADQAKTTTKCNNHHMTEMTNVLHYQLEARPGNDSEIGLQWNTVFTWAQRSIMILIIIITIIIIISTKSKQENYDHNSPTSASRSKSLEATDFCS